MRSPVFRLLTIFLSTMGLAGGGFYLYRNMQALASLPEFEPSTRAVAAIGHEEPAADAHGGGHGAPAADAHGGGHGAPAADTHGAPAADAHGGGHGETAAAAPSASVSPLISFDEIFVNILAGEVTHSLGVKLEIELFDEKNRAAVDKRAPGMKHTIIQVSREQDFRRLNTISGKLYYKELIVARLNEFLREPAVKDVHFASFFLQ